MTGAAWLCAEGAHRAGAGLVTLGVPARAHPLLASRTVATMTLALPETRDGTLGLGARKRILEFLDGCDAAAVGPGLGRGAETAHLCRRLAREVSLPLVLDADALHAIARSALALKAPKGPRVLTPHPGEMGGLVGKPVAEIQRDRERVATDYARRHGVVVVLKGHRTVVADGGRVYVNPTGNAGMAKGGTGDVLAGMIAALLGQKLEPFGAACLAVHAHGLAGDLARDRVGEVSLGPEDLLAALPDAFRRLAAP
jgi:NAD(P)H-hydrate epimerase